MDKPQRLTRAGGFQVALQRVVLGAFTCTAIVIVIVLILGEAVLSATGLSADPHGYAAFAGILFAAVLAPVALALWLLYQINATTQQSPRQKTE